MCSGALSTLMLAVLVLQGVTPPSVLEPQFVGLCARDKVAHGGQTWWVKPLKRPIDQLIDTIDCQRLTRGWCYTFWCWCCLTWVEASIDHQRLTRGWCCTFQCWCCLTWVEMNIDHQRLTRGWWFTIRCWCCLTWVEANTLDWEGCYAWMDSIPLVDGK
jgi:hypothetical protein